MIQSVTLKDVPDVVDRYHEPHRYYHNIMHVAYMHTLMMEKPWDVTEDDWHLIYIAVSLHDAIYDPRRNDNETQSAKLVDILCPQLTNEQRSRICELIIYTNPSTYQVDIPDSIKKAVHMIRKLDLWNFVNDGGRSIANSLKILKEYQFVPWGKLTSARNNFMRNLMNDGINDMWLDIMILKHNIEFLQLYKPHIGIYAGSFNPFHIGHLSVLEQADKHFDQLIVATPKGTNVSELYDTLPFHQIVEFEGPLTNLIQTYQCQDGGDVTLVRGIRDQNDLTYEKNLANIYRDMGLSCDIMYLMTEYPHVSSTIIRSMIKDNIPWDMYKSKKYDYVKDVS